MFNAAAIGICVSLRNLFSLHVLLSKVCTVMFALWHGSCLLGGGKCCQFHHAILPTFSLRLQTHGRWDPKWC